ncbi:hypothetical protein PC129_g708 [Phytophthora cactorum]|uniref:Uncharacterized protein n=1 Tax=Phytophthora cactorum TaxID=29920 RepID=A0A329SWH6_9STRA|nr:hypothetical protein Pcac1_g2054 [Phytophthora cactorum]KAG2844777.1 hypothetical protein PC112_g2085 [Phytophthora cactorum]KAG2845796.1 hypothetical protein PC111_g1448 [Phytophthora cactorum]KAG2867143.1 hypothetical protein PC113_g2206 [Phytophthora cactorum]KAG2930994.1 hypothetical protein PC114_g2316 [Phytophthora cactorum]
MMGLKPSSMPEWTAYEWRRNMQSNDSYAQVCAEDLQRKDKRRRSKASDSEAEGALGKGQIWF